MNHVWQMIESSPPALQQITRKTDSIVTTTTTDEAMNNASIKSIELK